MENATILDYGKIVTLVTEQGEIKGKVVHHYTGREKKQVIVRFTYAEQVYEVPFSRKTGKLYAFKLPFIVKLNIKQP